MHCPKCGRFFGWDDMSKRIDADINKWEGFVVPSGFYRCRQCRLIRPEAWWEALDLDINTEIPLPVEEECKLDEVPPQVDEVPTKLDDVPEELSGPQEAGWGG